MTSLTSPPLAPLLTRLFACAANQTSASWNALTSQEQALFYQDKTHYLQGYSKLKDQWFSISPQTGRLLYLLARSINAQHIVEFGTSCGLSTLHLAAALRDGDGGKLITTEFEPSKVELAQKHFEQANLADLIEIRCGDALITLTKPLPAPVDLLMLDGAKALYLDVLTLVEPYLREGALIIADDADQALGYLTHMRHSEHYLSLPLSSEMELSLKLGL